MVRTVKSHSIKYGRVEVKARLPKGDWIWPAIWMLPKNNVYGGWPASGEIDIMEGRGNVNGQAEGLDFFSSTLHWGPSASSDRWYLTHVPHKSAQGTFNDEFHTFGLEWTDSYILTYIDTPDQVVLRVPFDTGFYNKGGYKWPWNWNVWSSGSVGAPFDEGVPRITQIFILF